MGFTGNSSGLIQRDNTWVKGVDLSTNFKHEKKNPLI